jgi:hypothetical protein
MVLCTLGVTVWSSIVWAGPTVVRDEMLQDTSFTPVLGRGYSLATNTFQGICLSNIVKTKPSYNFNYKFEEVKSDGSLATTSSQTHSSSSFSYSLFSAMRKVASKTRYDASTKTTWHKHRLLATILVDIYYSSIDEAQSKMSPTAAALLKSKDIPGFFDACGMYYVRSISRQASLISMFTYESTSAERNSAFEHSLKVDTSGFHTNEQLRTTSAASNRASNLTIHTHGVGLGKRESADMISYDVATFRNAIKSAFQSTQPDDAGMVTSIEITPWVETPEFQALHRMEPQRVPMLDAFGVPMMDVTDPNNPKPMMKVVLPYAQKRTLSQNAEFLAEIDRAGRAKLNVFYKAKMCKAQIAIDHMHQSADGTWIFQPADPNNPEAGDRGDIAILNNRAPSDTSTIRALYQDHLTENNLQRIWMEYDAFMYGGTGANVEGVDKDPIARAKLARDILLGGNKNEAYPANVFPGAEKCVAELSLVLTTVSHRSIKSCQRIEETFATIAGRAIDDYCMPSEGAPVAKAGGSLNPLNR